MAKHTTIRNENYGVSFNVLVSSDNIFAQLFWFLDNGCSIAEPNTFLRCNNHKTDPAAVFVCDSSEPWMHVLCTLGGAWAAEKWVAAKYSMLADVNEIRAYKGLPPMVGTGSYFPFVPPVEEKKE